MKKTLRSTIALLLLCNFLFAQCPIGVEITEVLTDPNGNTYNFDTDGDGTATTNDEFIKICNTAAAAVNVGGLDLVDAGAGAWFTFPTPTMIMPAECVTVVKIGRACVGKECFD